MFLDSSPSIAAILPDHDFPILVFLLMLRSKFYICRKNYGFKTTHANILLKLLPLTLIFQQQKAFNFQFAS